MDLSFMTDEQKNAILHTHGQMLVSAGAGSGKTFMLSQRIAYLFSEESGPYLDNMDQVCTITFTEKAAEEVKNRIRKVLIKNGYYAQALKCDCAWISTIHGMCSRILHMHALDLDIDPKFSVIVDKEQEQMFNKAFNLALRSKKSFSRDGSLINKKYIPLIKDFNMESSYGLSLIQLINNLCQKASTSTNQWDAFNGIVNDYDIATYAKNLLEQYEIILSHIANESSNAALKAIEYTEKSIEELNLFINNIDDKDLINKFMNILEKCYLIPKTFGSSEVKDHIADFQSVYFNICADMQIIFCNKNSELLFELAKKTQEEYNQLKYQAGVLDNNDLLVLTYKAFQTNEEIRKKFQDKFKIVMIDEFQDTSQLQIDIIKLFCGNDLTKLCTVGDAQQSIYRFQGADISVYNRYKKEIENSDSKNAVSLCLTKNFRSHNDVLQMVEKIFKHPIMFGDGFLHLNYHNGRDDGYGCDLNRANVLFTGYYSGIKASDVITAEAITIAQKFDEYRKLGKSADDMVLLLGNMTHSQTYANALRSYGFDCVISGGSALNSTFEVAILHNLFNYLLNHYDTWALFNVLTSPLFNVSAGDLLDYFTNNKLDRKNYSKNLSWALDILNDASELVKQGKLIKAVKQIIDCCSLFYRLEKQGASGIAQAANILKIINMIDAEFHNFECGLESFKARIDEILSVDSKNAPGALSSTQKTGAIKIMTIHASKGLEFPIVAVAQYNSSIKSQNLITETMEDKIIWSMVGGKSFTLNYPCIEKSAKKFYDTYELNDSDMAFTKSPAINRACLMNIVKEREIGEDKRKLYVGLTRARDAVILAFNSKISKDGEIKYKSDIDRSIVTSFGLSNNDLLENRHIPYGGSEFIDFKSTLLNSENLDSYRIEENTDNERLFLSTEINPQVNIVTTLSQNVLSDMVSYSSLHRSEPYFSMDNFDEEEIETFAVADVKDRDKATDLGSAFHLCAEYEARLNLYPTLTFTKKILDKYQLSEDQFTRLDAALNRWFNSDIYFKTKTYSHRIPEMPFCVMIDNGEYLHGQMDLVCFNGDSFDGSDVLVIDYKTGGTDNIQISSLEKRHCLQAKCYTNALLYAGAKSVKIIFVYVEHPELTIEFK